MKKILIAIPTARYIEPETFKSIYELEIPEGYTAQFQYFYGYRVDQVRNLICDWVVNGFDYLFAVDHDITFPRDTLKRLISHNKDLVSGVYRQRVEPQQIEIFDLNQQRMAVEQLYSESSNLVRIGGCGFGCVLVTKEVIQRIGYPQFEYHVALNHNDTISEDTDFCMKAMRKSFSLWCDRTILCGHIGSTTMHVELPVHNPPTKAYIIHTEDKRSIDYAFRCAASCDKLNIPWVMFKGYDNSAAIDEFTRNNDIYISHDMEVGAAGCTASHFHLWQEIAKNNETAIILEHDALLLHPINMSIPDNKIVTLGYKLTDPSRYDHIAAGPPKNIIDIRRASGSHAYCITSSTAKALLKELRQVGAQRAIDNYYFMRVNEPGDTESSIPLAIMEPTPAICWVRESTIRDEASTLNYDEVESFRTNLHM